MTNAEQPLERAVILGLVAMGAGGAGGRQRLHRALGGAARHRARVQRGRDHRAVGDQRLRARVRRADRDRRPPRRHVRAAPDLLRRREHLRRLFGDRGHGPQRERAARMPGVDGGRRRDDVAGHTRHDLRHAAAEPGRSRGRVDPRRGWFRQRARPAARRLSHRCLQLALDLLPEPPHRRVRHPGHLQGGRGGHRHARRSSRGLCRGRRPHDRARRPALRARLRDRHRLDRPADSRAVRPCGRWRQSPSS